jgi:hypothetical protein
MTPPHFSNYEGVFGPKKQKPVFNIKAREIFNLIKKGNLPKINPNNLKILPLRRINVLSQPKIRSIKKKTTKKYIWK